MTRVVDTDAVVVGAGPNGLVAANLLADAGLSVLVLEAGPVAGGAIRSDESLKAGYVTDWFSSFYPLALAAPVLAALELPSWGVTWRHAPAVLAHVFADGRCAVLSRDAAATAESVEGFGAGDGAAWLRMAAEFERVRQPLVDALFTPFPPVRSSAALLRTLGVAEAMRFGRFAVSSVRRFGAERFAGQGARTLLAGCALHSDLAPEAAGSAFYGWLLCMLGQTVGFPVPAGGSGKIAEALVARLRARGGQLRLRAEVTRIDVWSGRVRGVHLRSGESIACDTVLADVAAVALYRDLVGPAHLPPRLVRDLSAFQWDHATLKLNWALADPIPWTAPGARGAGTVHLGADLDGMSGYAAALAVGRVPERPFLLLGQTTVADQTRSPAGTESAWAYTHLPAGVEFSAETIAEHARRVEQVLERHAPGFGQRILARGVQSPGDLHAADANLVGGAIGGGTAALHQQLLLRPIPGLGRAETPIDGLYLASASAHPGGGVHGGPGANAARAALSRRRPLTGALRRRALAVAFGRIYAER